MSKADLLEQGKLVMAEFCTLNNVFQPAIRQHTPETWSFGVCAYYRAGVTNICVSRCAAVGTAGRQWSYPGYTVDRTPYGVLQHELGHHVDVQRGSRRASYWSDFSKAIREQSGETPITSYCPNDAEWFAEMFRVFVTNPDLLRLVRPRTFRELRFHFTPVFSDSWSDRLRDAPERTRRAAERQIEVLSAKTSACDLFESANR